MTTARSSCSRCGGPLDPRGAACPRCLLALGLEAGGADAARRRNGPVDPLRIDGYRIVRRIGEGGMGVVYLAEQEWPIRRRVALKLIKPGMDTAQVLTRFESERHALASLDHPGIARAYDAGMTETGGPYFVMELVEGRPITSHCDARHATTRERLELFLQVCDAMQHAHRNAVIHRDLKPSNVLVCARDGGARPKIIDFGVAKAAGATDGTGLTEQGQVLGTPEYMSPEQAAGGKVDTRTDVYSLGVLLYELIVGVHPFDLPDLASTDRDEVRRRIRTYDPPTPSTRLGGRPGGGTAAPSRRGTSSRELLREVRGDVDWIVMKALEKDPGRRYASVAELAADLRCHLERRPVLAGPPGTVYRVRKFAARHRLAVGAASLVLLALLGGSLFAGVGFARASREAEAARRVSGVLSEMLEMSNPVGGMGADISAKEILDRAVERIRRDLAHVPLVRARLWDTVGRLYRSRGLYDEARPLLEESLAIRRGALAPDDPSVAESLMELATLLGDLAQFDRARQAYSEARAIREERFGADDPRTVACLSGLAGIARRLSDYAGARALYEEALERSERALGPEDPAVAEALDGLAMLAANDTRDYETARPLYERALAILEATYGSDDPRLTATLNNLAVVRWETGDLEGGLALLDRALVIDREAYGEEHPLVATDMENLGALYRKRGEFEQARRLVEGALRIRVQVLGPQHPDVAWSLTNLAQVLVDSGDLQGAQPYFERALEVREAALGPQHPEVARSRTYLARLLSRLGRPREARRLHRSALAIREASLAPGHPDVAASLHELANLIADAGYHDEARRMYERALGLREAALGPDHPEVAVTLRDLARLALQTQDLAAARRLHDRAIEILENALGPDHLELAEHLGAFARNHTCAGDPEGGAPYRDRALGILGRVLGRDSEAFRALAAGRC